MDDMLRVLSRTTLRRERRRCRLLMPTCDGVSRRGIFRAHYVAERGNGLS